jgi:signal transduction histidine kinase
MNAIDAMNGKGNMTFTTRFQQPANCIEIDFDDTGCGIPPENINKIFEPFFTTKGTGHGTGLGLSISHGIIQRHGGELKVSSVVGQGSTFTIILPVTRKDA